MKIDIIIIIFLSNKILNVFMTKKCITILVGLAGAKAKLFITIGM